MPVATVCYFAIRHQICECAVWNRFVHLGKLSSVNEYHIWFSVYLILYMLYIHRVFIVTNVYRVSQEEWTKLWESVPYVELYRYNPKHLYPKLNGYGDSGHRKVWASGVSTYCTPSVTPYSALRMPGNDTPLANIVMQWPWRDNGISCGLRKMLRNPKDNYDVSASVFVVQFNGFMSLTS